MSIHSLFGNFDGFVISGLWGRGGEDGAEAKTTVCAAGNHMLLLATGLPAGRKGCVIRLPLLRITSDLRLARKFFYVLFGK